MKDTIHEVAVLLRFASLYLAMDIHGWIQSKGMLGASSV